jgi:hypothetical protein
LKELLLAVLLLAKLHQYLVVIVGLQEHLLQHLSWSWRAVVRTLTSSLISKLPCALEELRARVEVTGKLPVVLFMKDEEKQYWTAAGGTAAVN